MARTLEDIARELIATVDADAGYLLGVQWLVKRYGQLATRTKLRHLRQVGQLSVPAPVSAGTITATRGSQVITGDATAPAPPPISRGPGLVVAAPTRSEGVE